MEQRRQQLTEREPDLRGWAELDAEFGEEAPFDAEISAGANGVSGRWRGAIPGIVFMATVAVMTLSQVPYAYLSIPSLTLASVAAILWLQATMDKSRIRLNLAVSPRVKQRIERLQEANDGASITEVLRRALAAYEELISIREEGSRLVVETPTGERERLRIL